VSSASPDQRTIDALDHVRRCVSYSGLAGFLGRRRPGADPARVPPGRYVTADFPVLPAGPTPHTPVDEWGFTIEDAVQEPVSGGEQTYGYHNHGDPWLEQRYQGD